MSCPYENWRDRCRLAAAAATARGDELSARYLGSLTDLSDDPGGGDVPGDRITAKPMEPTMTGINVPDILSRLHDLEQAVALLQRGAAATTPQALGPTDELLPRLMELQQTDPDHARFQGLRAAADWLRSKGFGDAATHMERSCGLVPEPDSPPANCAERLIRQRGMIRPLRGKPYASCAACGDDSPRWEACRRALFYELPAPSGGLLLNRVAAAIAHAHGNRFPDEHYQPLARWAVRAVARWLSNERWPSAAAVLRREVERD